MPELSDIRAMAAERSCALTAVAIERPATHRRPSGHRSESGFQSEFITGRRARAIPVTASRLDPPDPDMRRGTAVFAIEGEIDRISAE